MTAPAKLDDVSLSLRNPPEPKSKGPQAGEGTRTADLMSGTHLHSPSIPPAPQWPSIGWEQRVPARSRRSPPRVITRRP